MFKYNLISLQKLCTDLICSMIFNGTDCLLQNHLTKESPALLGRMHGGLYTTSSSVLHSTPSALLGAKEDLNTWHLRLGHVPFDRLKKITVLSLSLIHI